jgi:riboflavin kinase / FMN adenylyltransferase
MKIYTDLYTDQGLDTPGYISIGYFDSVHLGHQKILKELVNHSTDRRLHNFVLTFKNLPKKDKDNRSVLELRNRIEIIKSLGIKNMILCDYNPDLFSLSPEDFIKLIKKNFKISGFVVGKDFKFGRNKSGDIETIKNLGLDVHVVDHYKIDEKKASTSDIRNALSTGNIELANKYMGRPFFIEGIVNKGKQLGRTLGFPTMNINNETIIFPQSGTYVTKTEIKGIEYFSMTYVDENIIETYLLGYSDYHYNFKIKIDFFKKIRDNELFQSIDKLKSQLITDPENTKKYFGIYN